MKFYQKGQGPAILFIHGFPFDHTIWDDIVRGMEKDFTVITVDLPGISTETLKEDISMSSMAQQIHEYLIASNIPQVIIFGHSMGGYLGVEFLAQYPENVAGLSFVHSLANADDEEKKAHRDKVLKFLEKGEAEKMPFLKTMVPSLFYNKEAHQYDIQKILDNSSQIPVYNIYALYKSIKERRDHIDTITHSPVPLQWIIGDQDQATPMSQALQQCYKSPQNMVNVIRDCAHMSMFEYPEVLKKYVHEFCEFIIR